ncbi:NatC N(alpha)-terminal acetyltransferase Mak10 subunit [Penicillium chermesinum]|uniref:NatC N(Alpha)-terminal acetyltransferase Mak10 subunit n=1 Tax=Penicillium chermesinum TaxID=63820 RepID=A0A9W9PBK1_9EURO|nr:NatC N(alpha)-terminal acetyltransferase Mak10 subunit [Penicillium chermesinum]KAJ5240238.1 NatC N(alpha)-terminal acetyltransferase Mak10 subunit [Penicillium chermesinum]
MAWHMGHPLSQTLFTSIYLDRLLWPVPKTMEDAQFARDDASTGPPLISLVLRSYCLALVKACDFVHARVAAEYYYEEEDFVTQLYNRTLLSSFDSSHFYRLLDQAVSWVEKQDTIDQKLREALRDRLLFRYEFLSALDQDLNVLETRSTASFTTCLQKLSSIKESAFLGKQVPESFSLKIQRKLASTVPPRPIVEISHEDAFSHIKRLCQDAIDLEQVLDYRGPSNFKTFIWTLLSRKTPTISLYPLLGSSLDLFQPQDTNNACSHLLIRFEQLVSIAVEFAGLSAIQLSTGTTCRWSWAYHQKLNQLRLILQMGFELSIYAPEELPGMYWYLSHICSTHLGHVDRIRTFMVAARKRDLAMTNQSASAAARKATAFHNSFRCLERLTTELIAVDAFAIALHALYVLLARHRLLPCASAPDAYWNDKLRYELRMKPFIPISLPELVPFEEYQKETTLEGDSDEVILERASKAIAEARKAWEATLGNGAFVKDSSTATKTPTAIEADWQRNVKDTMRACIAASLAIEAVKKALASKALTKLEVDIPPIGSKGRFHDWWSVPKLTEKCGSSAPSTRSSSDEVEKRKSPVKRGGSLQGQARTRTVQLSVARGSGNLDPKRGKGSKSHEIIHFRSRVVNILIDFWRSAVLDLPSSSDLGLQLSPTYAALPHPVPGSFLLNAWVSVIRS